jgi:RNA polymerase sigma-70 factor (ECF subfamily)
MDDEAFAAMIESHRGLMRGVALSVLGSGADEVEDVVQDACLLAWRARGQFDGRKPGGWLATITRNQAITIARRRRFVAVVLDHLPDRPDPHPSPDDEALHRDLGEALALALATLPPDQRDAVLLRDRDGIAYADMAAALGVSLGTIKTRLWRGRGRMKTLMATA